MIFYLSKNTRILWQIRTVFAFSFISSAILFFCRFTRLFLLLSVLVFTTGMLVTFIYLPIYFKKYKICAFENAIIIEKGILFKTIHIMPYPRLIFTQCITTPLSALLKMKSIILRASRGYLFIPELDNNFAEKLIENMGIEKNDKNGL